MKNKPPTAHNSDQAPGACDFPRSARLTHAREFSRVFQSGRRIKTRALVVHVAPGTTADSRVGIAVGRKYGPATRRNAFRRAVREAFRRRRGRFAIKVTVAEGARPEEWTDPLDMVILPRASKAPGVRSALRQIDTDVAALTRQDT